MEENIDTIKPLTNVYLHNIYIQPEEHRFFICEFLSSVVFLFWLHSYCQQSILYLLLQNKYFMLLCITSFKMVINLAKKLHSDYMLRKAKINCLNIDI